MDADTQENSPAGPADSPSPVTGLQAPPAGGAGESRQAAGRPRLRPSPGADNPPRSQQRVKGRLRPFQPAASEKADEAPGSLQGEISMLRMLIHRVLELSRGVDDLDQAMDLLEGVSKAAARLANMLKVQVVLQREGGSDLAQSLSRALAEVMQEMGLK
jgi:hypothetical protein